MAVRQSLEDNQSHRQHMSQPAAGEAYYQIMLGSVPCEPDLPLSHHVI